MKIHLFLLFIQAAILQLTGGDGRNWSKSEFEKDSKDLSVATQEFIPYDLNYRTKIFQGSQSKKDTHKSTKRSFFENSALTHTESADSSQEFNRRRYYNTMSSLRSTRKRNNKDKQMVNGRNSTEKDVSRQEQNAKNYKRPMRMMTVNKNGRSNVHNKKTDTMQMYRQLLLKTGQMEKFRKLGKVKQRQLIRRLLLKNRKMAKLKPQNEMNRVHQISRVPELNQVAETSHVTGLSRVPEKATTEISNRFLNTPTSRNTTFLNVWSDRIHSEKHVSLKNDPSHRNAFPLKSYKKDQKYSTEENQRLLKHKKEQVMQQKFDSYQREKGKNRKSFFAMTSPNMIDSGTHQPNAFMFNHNGDIVHYRGSSYQTIYPEFEQQRSFAFKTNAQYLKDIPNTSQPDIKTKKEDENVSEIKIDEENNVKKKRDEEKPDNKDDVDNEMKISFAEDKDKYDSQHQTQTKLPATFTIRTKNYNDMKSNFRTSRYDIAQQFNHRPKQRRLIKRRKLHFPSTNLPLKTFRNQFKVKRRQNRYGMLRETPRWSNFRADIGQPSQYAMISSDHRKDMPVPRKEDQDSSEDTSESEQNQFSPSYYHTLTPGLNSMDIAGGFQYNYHPYTGNDQLDQHGKVDYYQQYPNTHVEDNNEDSSDENTSTEQEQGDEKYYQEPPSYVDMHGSDVALDTGRANEVNHFYGESTIIPLGQLKHDQDDDEQDDNINSSENAVEETSAEEQDNRKQLQENIHKNHDSPDTLLIVLDNDSKTKKNIDNEEHNQFKQSSSEDLSEGKKASPIMKADHSYSNGILVILDNDGETPVSTIKPPPTVEQSGKFPEDKHKESSKTIDTNIGKTSSSYETSNKHSPLNETSNKHSYIPLNITKNNEITNKASNNFTKTLISINDISFSLNSSDQRHRPSFSVNNSNQLYRTSFKSLRQLGEKKSSLNNLLIELGTKENIFNIRAPSRGISKHVGDYHKGISESKTLRKDQRFRLGNKLRLVKNRYKSNARKIKNKFRYKNIGHPFKNVPRTGNSNISMRKRFRKLYPNIHFQADTELFGNRVREVVEIPDIDWTLNGSNLEGDNINLLKKSKSTENRTLTSDDFPQEDLLERFPQNNNVIRGIHSKLHTIKTDVLDSPKIDSQSIEDDNRHRKISLEYPKGVDDYRHDPLHGIPNVFTVVSSTKDDDDDDDSTEHSQSDHNLVINTIKYKSPNIDMHHVNSLNPAYLNTLKDIGSFVDTQNEDKDDFNEGADAERGVQGNMEYTNKQSVFHPLLARGREDSYKTISSIQLNHENMSPVYGEISGSQEEFPDIERDHIIGDYHHYPKFDNLKTKIQLPAGIYQDKLYGIDSDDENEELPLMYRDIMYKERLSKHDNNRISHDNEDTHSTSDIVNTMNRNNLNNLHVLGNADMKPHDTFDDSRNNSRIKVNHPLILHSSISALYGQSPLNHDDTFDSVEDSHLESNSMADELNYRNEKWKLISSSSHNLHNKIPVKGADTPELLGFMESEQKLNENRLKSALKKKTSSLFKSHLRNRDNMSDDASIRSIEGVRSDQEFYRTTSGRKGEILGQGKREENREIYFPRGFHRSEIIWRKNRNWKSPLRGLETQNIPRQYWLIYKLLKEGNLPEKYRRLYDHLKDEIDKIVNKSSQVDIHKIHKTYVHKNLSDSNEVLNKYNIKLTNRSDSFPPWDNKSEVELLNRKERDKKTNKEIIDIDLTRQNNKEKLSVVDVHDDTQVALEGIYLKSSLDANNNDLETLEIGGRPLEDENSSGDFRNNTFEQNSKNWRDSSFDIGISNPRWNNKESRLEKNISLNDKDYNTNKLSYQKLHKSFSDYDLAKGQGSENSYPLVDERLGKTQLKNYFDENIPGQFEDGVDFRVHDKVNKVQQKHNININSRGLNGKDLDPTDQGNIQYATGNGSPLTDIIDNHQYENAYNYHGSIYDPYDYLGGVDISHLDPVEKAFPVPYNNVPHDTLGKIDNQGNHLDSSGLTNRNLPKHKLMKSSSYLLSQYSDEMNLNDRVSPEKNSPLVGKDAEKFKIMSKRINIDTPGIFGSDFQEKSDQVVLDKYFSHDMFQKVYKSLGEGKHLQDSHGERKHSHDNHRERKQLQGSHGERKHLRGNLWEGKHSQDSYGDRKPSHDSLWEGKLSKHSHREAKPFQDSHGDTQLLQSQRDINDDEDDSKTQEIDIAKLNDNELIEDIDDGDAKHYSSGSSYYSDFIGQPLGLTEKSLPNKFQISPSNVLSTSATIIYRNKTTEKNRAGAKEIDVKEIDHRIFPVTQKKIFKSSLPSSVSNLEVLDSKWSYPSTNKGNAIRNVSFKETHKKQLADIDAPLTSSYPPQFQNISKASKDIDIKGIGIQSQLKDIDNTTEEMEAKRHQSSFLDGTSFEPTLSDLVNTSVKIRKDSTHQKLVTFSKEDHQVSKDGSSELRGIPRIDFNSSHQIYQEPTFLGEMVQIDDANATEIPKLTSANDFLIYDENSYDLLPEESWRDEKNITKTVDEVHDDRINSSMYVEGTIRKWGRGGHSIKPTTSQSDDKSIDDISKKDIEKDLIISQASYVDEGEHLLAEIEHGELFPRLDDKKIHLPSEDEYREHQHHMGASPINRDIHQLHHILPDILLVEEPDISHKPTSPQSTTSLKSTEKHVKISETLKRQTVPVIDTDKQVFFKGSDIDKEKKRITGKTEASKLDFFERDSFLKPETRTTKAIEGTQTVAKHSSTYISEHEVTGTKTEQNILKTNEDKIPPISLSPLDFNKKSSHGVGFKIPTLGLNTRFITHEEPALPIITAGLQEKQSTFLHTSNDSVSKIGTQDVLDHLISEQGQKSSKVSYNRTTHDIKTYPSLSTLGVLQLRKYIKRFNRTSGYILKDKLDIAKSDTTLLGIEKLRKYESTKPDSTLQSSGKLQSQDHKYLEGILQSTDESRSHQPTIKVDTLQSGEPPKTDVTFKSTDKLRGYKTPELYVTLQDRHKPMRSKSAIKYGTTHDIDISKSPKTIQLDGGLYSGGKSHSYESTQLHGTFYENVKVNKPTQVGSTSYSGEESRKPEPAQLDGILQGIEETKLRTSSHLDGVSLDVDVVKIHEEPTQPGRTLSDIEGIRKRNSSQLDEFSVGRSDSRGHTPIQFSHTMQDIEELRREQPIQLHSTLHGREELRHTPVQPDGTSLGIDESHGHELSQINGTSLSIEEEIFHKETKLHNTSHGTDEARRYKMIKLQNISYDIAESGRNESTHIHNMSRSIDESKGHKPIQLDTTLYGRDKSNRLESTQLDGTSYATGESYGHKTTKLDSTLYGTSESKRYEPTQLDGTLNVGTGKLDEYIPTQLDGTLHGIGELHGHKLSQLHGTLRGADTSHGQEQIQLEGTLNVGAGKLDEYEPTQLDGTLHGTGKLTSHKPSLLDGTSDGFNMSHGQELIQIDGISHDTGGLHGHKLSELDGTLRGKLNDGTGELYGHRPTEIDATLHGIHGLHGHESTQTDNKSHVIGGPHEYEPFQLDGTSHGTGELNTYRPSQLDGTSLHSIGGLHEHEQSQLDGTVHDTHELHRHKPSYLDRSSQSTAGLHGHESSQVDGISYSIDESISHKLTQPNGSLYNIKESRRHSEPQQHDISHGLEKLNKYKTTRLYGSWHGKSIFKSDETVKSDVDLHINDTSRHGETEKTDGSIKLTSYQMPKLTGVHRGTAVLASYEPSKQHGALDFRGTKSHRSSKLDGNLQDAERTVMGDISRVTDKSKTYKPFKFDRILDSTDKSRIYQSTKQDISLDDTDKSRTLDGTRRRTEELGIVRLPKTDIMYHSTEELKSYEPVKTDEMLYGSTKLNGASQDTDTLRGYDPLELDAISHSTAKVGDYLSTKIDEVSDGTGKSISYEPTKIFGTSHDADKLKSSQTIQFDDTSHHTLKYIDRMKSYDPTKVVHTFQVSDKSRISEPTKMGSPVADSTLDMHTLMTHSKSSDGIFGKTIGRDTLHPSQRITIKSSGRSWIKIPTLDNGFSKVIQTLPQDTDHQTSKDPLYQTSFTDKYRDKDEVKVLATTRIKEEKAIKYSDLDRTIGEGIPTFVSSTLEPPKDGKVLSLEGEMQRETEENDGDSHKLPLDMSDTKIETFTDATLQLVQDTGLASLDSSVYKTREIGLHSASELTHVYPSVVTRSPDHKEKTEKDFAINASSKQIDDLSSISFTANITKEKLSNKSEDFPKENMMGSLSSLEPKISSSRRISAPHQTFSGISSILDKNQDQNNLKTLLDLPSTLLFGQFMDLGLTSKSSSIEANIDRTEHFPGVDALRHLTGSAPKEKKKIVTQIVSDLFQTKHQDMKHFIEKKTPTGKTPAVKLEEQNVDMTGFARHLDHKPVASIDVKNVSIQLPSMSKESIFFEFDTDSDLIPVQQAVTMTTHTKAEKSVTDIDHKLKSHQTDQIKFQTDSIKVQAGLETDLTDESIPLPEYTSFVNYQDSIYHRASTSGVPIHMLTPFNSSFTKTDQKEELFPEILQSNIPLNDTPVLDFTEDDRKIPTGRTTPHTHSDISSAKKQQFHTRYFTNQYKNVETERSYAVTGYPSIIEHFDRTDLMKFHIPGDSTISTYSRSTLSQTTPNIPREKTTWFRKALGMTSTMKTLKPQPDSLLQTVTPSTRRSDIKNIWEDNSSLMLNLYETSKFTKASFHRKKESAYYLVESVDNVARSLKLHPLGIETCVCYFTKQKIEVSCKKEMRGRIIKLTVPSMTRDENIQCSVRTYNDSWKGYESCLEGRKYCDHMFGTRFRQCMLQLGRENLLKYYTMCNSVMCRENGDMQQWKNDACDVIDALAYECEIIGIKVSWREVTKCYKKCPENMAFKHNVSMCRITCDNYNTEINCPTDETESRCDCREGYVLSRETCVPVRECGCVYQDYFLEVGQTVTLFGCNMMAVCVRDRFGWSNIEYHELPGCSPRESCHLVNESYECIVHCGGEVCHENATCEEDKCRCHVGLYGDGVTTCRSTLGVCSCLVSGLSRYRTYDGQMIHYLSTCPVELTTTVGQSTNTKLSVYSTSLFSNELMLSFGTQRYRTANVTIDGLNIYMDTSGKTYVNNVKITLPFKDNQVNVSISYTAGWITICSEDGVSVSYDSKHRIKMFLPKEYRGKLTGICGNCNGVHDELKNRHGKTATTSEIIGRSYSLNTSHSCGPVTIKKCERGVKRCELMRSGMFADCHPYLDDGLVQSYYDSCMHMTCAFKSYTDYMDKLTCAALESLDTECMSRGYIVEWRSQRLCPVSCCRPMMYNQHVNETEESCVPSLEICPIRPVDGCTCGEGYVLDNNKCVLPRDCGCWYNNSLYIQLGETIHLPGCNTMVQCRKVATGKRNLVITNLPEGCGNNSLCILKDHKYQCVCEEGFARNKNDTFCLKIPECGDQPVDVVFVVDVSGSINVTGLNSTKHFLTHFINSTNIGRNNMQISILLFNDKPHSLFQLNRYTEKKQMLDAVYKIGPPEGTTYLGRALVFVALVSLQEKMGARDHVNRAVVILTDGVLHDAERAERWGALLRRQKKAELFAIGVGEADPAQLQRLTRNRNNVFYVREYVQLNGIMDILLQSVCM